MPVDARTPDSAPRRIEQELRYVFRQLVGDPVRGFCSSRPWRGGFDLDPQNPFMKRLAGSPWGDGRRSSEEAGRGSEALLAVGPCYFSAALAFLVSQAFFAARLRALVRAAFLPAALRLRVRAAFCPEVNLSMGRG